MEDSAAEFISWDPNPVTKGELQQLLDTYDSDKEKLLAELKPMFEKRIAFGTAGLRAKMSPGYSRMNDLIVLQTSQGLLSYLAAQLGEDAAQKRGRYIEYRIILHISSLIINKHPSDYTHL